MSLLQVIRENSSLIRQERSIGEYVDQLLAVFPRNEQQKVLHDDINQSNQALIDPLSERELEVLNLMAMGNSYEQVAQKLFVAPSTVRWHVKNIFQKLNVHIGLGAIAAARELKILK